MKANLFKVWVIIVSLSIVSCSDDGPSLPGGGGSVGDIFTAEINGEAFGPTELDVTESNGTITLTANMTTGQNITEFIMTIPITVSAGIYRYDGSSWGATLDITNSSGMNSYVPNEAEGDLIVAEHNTEDEYLEATFEFSAKNTEDDDLPLAEVTNGVIKIRY